MDKGLLGVSSSRPGVGDAVYIVEAARVRRKEATLIAGRF